MKIYLSLGSNLGNRIKYINNAIKELQDKVGKLIQVSKFYETEPWGFKNSNDFLNIIAVFDTHLSPLELLSEIKDIEISLDRRKKNNTGYESRTIDIDIIFYGKQFFYMENLQIPHVHAHKRKFVLMPLMDIAPDYVHPLLKISVNELLKRCEDKSKINELLVEPKLSDYLL